MAAGSPILRCSIAWSVRGPRSRSTSLSITSVPWSGSLPMTRLEGLMYEYACHEGNYAIAGILSGARAEEAAEQP